MTMLLMTEQKKIWQKSDTQFDRVFGVAKNLGEIIDITIDAELLTLMKR